MGHKLAIDFGTTNSVIARWDEAAQQADIVRIGGLSDTLVETLPPLTPSLLYVQDGKLPSVIAGQAVRDGGLDRQQDNRLFRNFKRGIVSSLAVEPRRIDGEIWADKDAGRSFLRTLIDRIPYDPSEVDQLVLTAPVVSFEGYLAWLNDVIETISPDRIRVVDESTAAALGYAVTKPGAVVLVFDFGGGTLDLSLVQLPDHREKAGGFLSRLRRGGAAQHMARVIAKAGRVIGGSDIDQWLLAEILKRAGLSPGQLGSSYTVALTHCEQAKIALSSQEQASIEFEADGKSHTVTITRPELEQLLEDNGFYTALRRVVDKVMHVARQRGIFKEDIHYVLMVGGISLMPSVQRTLGAYFSDMAVRADKPFTAVAEGALQMAAGFGLEDYLIHSYGLRHLNAVTGAHEYDEIIPMGSSYPIERPIEVRLGAAHDNQAEVEFVIGEIDTDSVAMIEVKYEGDQAVFVAKTGDSEQKIVVLNEDDSKLPLVKLNPAGIPGEDRLKAQFTVDERRQLRVTVTDLHTAKTLLDNIPLATLR